MLAFFNIKKWHSEDSAVKTPFRILPKAPFREWDGTTAGFLVGYASGVTPWLLSVWWGGVLWVPPVHELHTLYRIQYYLGPTLIPPLLPPVKWWVLEHQSDAVVSHICAYIYCEQSQGHTHDDRGKYEVESCDLKNVAVRVWVCMDIFILNGPPQRLGTAILTTYFLLYKLEVELPQCFWSCPCNFSDPEK